MTKNDDNLIWVDLEMTGLDPETDVVIEIATIVTDKDLNILAEGPVIAIHQPDEVLDNMNEWCVVQHGKSGLTERVRQSNINEDEASELTLSFLKKWVDEASRQCAAIVSVRIAALWLNTCQSWRPIFTIGILMSVR